MISARASRVHRIADGMIPKRRGKAKSGDGRTLTEAPRGGGTCSRRVRSRPVQPAPGTLQGTADDHRETFPLSKPSAKRAPRVENVRATRVTLPSTSATSTQSWRPAASGSAVPRSIA